MEMIIVAFPRYHSRYARVIEENRAYRWMSAEDGDQSRCRIFIVEVALEDRDPGLCLVTPQGTNVHL